MFNDVIAISEDAVISGAKPHDAAAVFQYGPYLLPAESCRYFVLYERAGMPAAQPLIGPNPDIMVVVLEETPNADVGKAVSSAVAGYTFRRDAIESTVGGDPHVAPGTLEKTAYEVTCDVVPRSIGIVHDLTVIQMIGAASARTNPGRTIPCAIDRAYGSVSETGEIQRSWNPVRDAESTLDNHPDFAVRCP